ncbi:PX domain-containing protein ypt35 [Saitozyma podzolica]|uniref:Endosomal/vacuolar adapter protein YPT35 n=1 Tax=Saitozyma podzolica TaxID=1890683 RepID=A0A427YNG7_9TREE|nr:PX domain-containing protein ypt35 [Saitozyma podzolica]
MSQTHPRLLLEPLSRSPSPSGSLSSSSSFDPHLIDQLRTPAGPSSYAQPDARGTSRPTLGLRELASMAYSDRQARKAKDSGGDNATTFTASRSLPGSARGSLDVPRRPIEMRRGSSEDGGAGAFAREVVITGHKVVGGKTWTDKARMGAYVVYEIEITTRSGGTINLLRRYTDFVRLRNALKSTYPHLYNTIPQLPGKAHMSKFSPKFLEDRQPRLQRFLRTVMLHPEMGRAGEGSVIGQWIIGERGAGT